jgi:peptide deformylase
MGVVTDQTLFFLALRAVELMKIVRYPHPSLRHKVRPLTSIDKQVRLEAGQMLELMYEAHGIGLATNQVFLSYQMFVLNPSADANQRELEAVYINPVILERKGTIEGEEGCLSFPGLFQKVRRAKTIRLQAYNLEGKLIEVVPRSDLESRALQHEVDHLHGVLFIDKMGTLGRLASRSTLKTFEREYRLAQERGEIPSDEEINKKLKENGDVM